MRRSFSGQFSCKDLGGGHWRLRRAGGCGVEIHLLADGSAPADFDDCTGVAVDWRGAAAMLSIESPRGARALAVRSALVHEPRPELYDCLPLARFDAKAKRFWRRVFRLVRLPGGRYLLGILARHA